MSSLEKSSDNRISDIQQEKIIESCQQQIGSSVQLDTDNTYSEGARSVPAVRFSSDYPLLCRVRSPNELIATDLSDSRHEQVCFDLGDYSVVTLLQCNLGSSTGFSVLVKHEQEESLRAFTLYYAPFTGK